MIVLIYAPCRLRMDDFLKNLHWSRSFFGLAGRKQNFLFSRKFILLYCLVKQSDHKLLPTYKTKKFKRKNANANFNMNTTFDDGRHPRDMIISDDEIQADNLEAVRRFEDFRSNRTNWTTTQRYYCAMQNTRWAKRIRDKQDRVIEFWERRPGNFRDTEALEIAFDLAYEDQDYRTFYWSPVVCFWIEMYEKNKAGRLPPSPPRIVVHRPPVPISIPSSSSTRTERLTEKQYSRCIESHPTRPEDGGDCSICLSKLRKGYHQLKSCSHRFHQKCLKRWLRKDCVKPTCPLCRTNVIVKK